MESALERLEKLVQSEIERDKIKRPAVSIIIPIYNERDTVRHVIDSVLKLPIEKQVIVVDDGSTDGTREMLYELSSNAEVEVFLHAENQGKGAALQSGFFLAEGEIVIIQDADCEYDPAEILHVIEPIRTRKADVVYGSRYFHGRNADSHFHYLGNQLLTRLINRVLGVRLTDMETCYKAFRREVIRSIPLRERRFGFEPEITAKLARRGFAIHEVPVNYTSRSRSQGKKIGVRDLFNAIYCIFRYGWFG